MLKEAIQHIEAMAQKAASARVVNIPGDGRTAFVEHNGTLKEIPVKPEPRDHTVDSVADLVKASERWEGPDFGNVIWISGEKLVLVIDDDDRRDTVTMPLVESFVFRRIKQLANHPALDQAALVRLLRVELRGVVNATSLLTAVRKIKFRQQQSGHSEIQNGNESLGKSIAAEVTGAEAIPEMLVVETNLYSNPGLDEQRFAIGLDLEIDVKNQRFNLRPVPDEIEKVTATQLAEIRGQIERDAPDVPVFFGKP